MTSAVSLPRQDVQPPMPQQLPLPVWRHRPWFWKQYARRLEREVMLLHMRLRSIEAERKAKHA